MAEVFGAAATLDYVDYGVTVTGDTNVAYARFKSADGAAEAVRLLASTGQVFNGQAVLLEVLYEDATLEPGPYPAPNPTPNPGPNSLEVLHGAALREYLERSAAQRAKSAPNRHRKKNKWRERKWGAGNPPAADGGEAKLAGCAAAVGAKRSREAPSGAEDAGEGTDSKHTRSE
jgi:hypothetical protein